MTSDTITDTDAGSTAKPNRLRRLFRRLSIVAAGLAAAGGGLTMSPAGAHASEQPTVAERPAAHMATVTVCFQRSVVGTPFTGATVVGQYRTVNGSYQNAGVSQTTNAYGCATFNVTGGVTWRFYAHNVNVSGSPGYLGRPSSGFSGAYTVYGGYSYHFGTWIVF